MNNSGTTYELYAINSPENATHWHIVDIICNIADGDNATYQEFLKDSTLLKDNDLKNINGYQYNGLFNDEALTEAFYVNSELVTKSMTLYASYTPEQYDVKFFDEDGTIISEQTVAYGEPCEQVEAPEKPGYVFIGWSPDDISMITQNSEFTAKYISEDEYTTVSLNKTGFSSMVGCQFQFKAVLSNGTLDTTDLTWVSSDPEVASVDNFGLVSMKESGMTTITVTVDATGESAECVVSVSANPDLEIVLAKNSKLDIFDGCLRRIPDKANSIEALAENFLNEELIFTDKSGNVLTEGALLGTGGKVTLKDGEATLDEIIAIMTGDYDGNGIINNRDVAMLNNLLVDKLTADDYQILAVDVNGDGAVNNRDAAILARYLVGKEAIA